MKEKYNDATPGRPNGERIIDARSLVIDLPAYLRQIRKEDAWHKGDRNSITVFKTDGLCIVAGALRKDAVLPPHDAEGTMSIQVLDGLLELNTDDTYAILSPGQMMAIHKGCPYNAVARQDTAYLLTITS